MKDKEIIIKRSRLEDGVKRGIINEGLYWLENIFGKSRGHGTCLCGQGSEDIQFDIGGRLNTTVWINDNGRRLKIGEYDDLENQRGEYYGDVQVDIRPETIKYLLRKLCD